MTNNTSTTNCPNLKLEIEWVVKSRLSFPKILYLLTILEKITQLIYISLVKGISPMLLQHFLRQKYLTTIPVVLGFQTKYGLLKLKTCSLYYKNLLLKFGRSEKGTKFEKNLPLSIWRYSVASNFKWKIFSNFVPFSECPNFFKLYFFWINQKFFFQVVKLPAGEDFNDWIAVHVVDFFNRWVIWISLYINTKDSCIFAGKKNPAIQIFLFIFPLE